MGAFLEKPKTEKVTAKGEGCGIRFGVSAMQGWRMEMEDAHVCDTSFSLKDWGFFGVFDGHAGPKVSQYCSQHLLDCIVESIEGNKDQEVSADAVKKGIHKGFLVLDERLKKLPQWANGEDRSGTTAIVVMVSPKEIIWGNCGDSRGLLCRNGKVEFATEDHKPFNEKERNRIEKAGGTVMMQRVNGSLAVSRALGDFDYKRASELPAIEQLVSPEPEITIQKREPSTDEFLFLACDGVFDVMTNEDVIAYIRHHLELTDDLSQICSDLIDTCLNKNSRDNMSAVLVTFPSAPKVSQEAIEKDRKLQERAREAIERELKECAEKAQDPLELEEGHVMQQLNKLSDEFDLLSKRQFISERLQELRKEKFGNAVEGSLSEDLIGPSDASEAPDEMQHFFSSPPLWSTVGEEKGEMANSESQLPKEENMDTKEEKTEEEQDMETTKENTSKQDAKT